MLKGEASMTRLRVRVTSSAFVTFTPPKSSELCLSLLLFNVLSTRWRVRVVQRLSVAEAAQVLGISQQAVHGRIKRETIEHDRGEDGKIYVYVEDNGVAQGVVNHVVNDYITSLKSEIESLKKDREVWIEEAKRKDTIIMALTNRIPELEAPSETPSEATESVVTDSDTTSRGVVPPTTQNRSWWRRIFAS